MLTMEKPRSDIFPFLDRVTYLCLGDVVYTGATRMMLDYFRYTHYTLVGERKVVKNFILYFTPSLTMVLYKVSFFIFLY